MVRINHQKATAEDTSYTQYLQSLASGLYAEVVAVRPEVANAIEELLEIDEVMN